MSKKVIITGANGGFGQLIVNQLLAEGHQVVGTMRAIEGRNAENAAKLREAGAQVVEMDVTSTESVDQGVAKSIELLGGLDVVVNNAGLGVLGIQEQFTPEDFHRILDINVVGVHRVNRAALPYLRKQGKGVIVYISSLLGRMTIPFYGPYNASKWALEALAENNRVELSGFGIESVLIEPGGFPTNFMHSLVTPSDDSRNAEFGDFQHAPKATFEGFEQAMAGNPEQDPKNVALAVSSVLAQPHGNRSFRTVVDKMGMGTHIEGYNDHLAKVTEGIYTAFGTDGMLKVAGAEAEA
ncbi:MAG: SDR family oxidoreductase [Salibacteraceae bacterium]